MSKQHAVYYLVDTENPGGFNTVEDLLKKTEEEKCRLYLFYSENTSKLAPAVVEKMLNAGCVKLIRVKTGHNSLDFCLISMAGYLCAKHPKASFVILSDDHGYDNAIRMWQDAGIRMSRTGSPEKPAVKKAKPASAAGAAPQEASPSVSKKKKPVSSGGAALELSARFLESQEQAVDAVPSEEDSFSLPERMPEIPEIPVQTGSAPPVILDGRMPSLPRGSRAITRLDASANPVPQELLQAVQELLLDAGIRDLSAQAALSALAAENAQDYLVKTCGCTSAEAASFFQKTDRVQRRVLSRLAQRSLQGGC